MPNFWSVAVDLETWSHNTFGPDDVSEHIRNEEGQ